MLYNAPARHGHSFWTKDLQRMIIDSLGNIGIGVATPKYKLQILGGFSQSDTLLYLDKQSYYIRISSVGDWI